MLITKGWGARPMGEPVTKCCVGSSEDSTIHQKCGWREGWRDERVRETERGRQTARERCGGCDQKAYRRGHTDKWYI